MEENAQDRLKAQEAPKDMPFMKAEARAPAPTPAALNVHQHKWVRCRLWNAGADATRRGLERRSSNWGT
jgi:hypothetical protein